VVWWEVLDPLPLRQLPSLPLTCPSNLGFGTVFLLPHHWNAGFTLVCGKRVVILAPPPVLFPPPTKERKATSALPEASPVFGRSWRLLISPLRAHRSFDGNKVRKDRTSFLSLPPLCSALTMEHIRISPFPQFHLFSVFRGFI